MQKNQVNDISWAPNSLNLNVSSNDSKIFLWSLRGASICQVPSISQKENFKVTKIIWNQNGKNFAAVEQNSGLVFVYP
jgi:WD40 repeat protein